MKKLVVFFYVLVITLTLSCGNQTIPTIPANTNVISNVNFSVDGSILGLTTLVKGEIFVKSNDDNPQGRDVQIISWIEVDPKDWGGVSFLIPEEWEISDITSSFPRGSADSARYIVIQQIGSAGNPKEISIGNSKLSGYTGGGVGVVIIVLSKNQEIPDNLELKIGVGSKGDTSQTPIGITVEVPLEK